MLAPALSCKLSSHNDQLMNKNCKLLFEASFQVLKTNLNDAAVLSRLDSIDFCKISLRLIAEVHYPTRTSDLFHSLNLLAVFDLYKLKLAVFMLVRAYCKNLGINSLPRDFFTKW